MARVGVTNMASYIRGVTIVDTILYPTTGAASPTPSFAASELLCPHHTCRGIVTADVLELGLSLGAIATRKLGGVKSGQRTRESYTSSAPYGEGKAYV